MKIAQTTTEALNALSFSRMTLSAACYKACSADPEYVASPVATIIVIYEVDITSLKFCMFEYYVTRPQYLGFPFEIVD